MASTSTRPFVFDTDMGADDFMALSLLLSTPSLALQAVTVTGTGLSHLGPGTRSALDILMLGGQPDVPVAEGAQAPFDGGHAFPASWRESTDKRFGIALPTNPNGPSSMTAAKMLSSAIRGATNPILVATGPLTNVAQAFMDDPQLPFLISTLYIMGGAVDVPGNVNATHPKDPNTVAEWNFYADPKAADIVLRSGASITLVPLDITNLAPITSTFLASFSSVARTPLAKFVVEVLDAQQPAIDDRKYFFWDPLAAALAIDPSFASYTLQSLGVSTEPGPTSLGKVLRLGPSPTTQYGNGLAAAAGLAGFEAFFVSTLNGG